MPSNSQRHACLAIPPKPARPTASGALAVSIGGFRCLLG